ncbi:unnamed protein product [Brassica oleracea var. botrytis]
MTSSDSVKTSKKSGEITNLMTQLSSEVFISLGKTSKKEEVKTHLWGNLRNNGVQLKPTFLHCLLWMTVAVWDVWEVACISFQCTKRCECHLIEQVLLTRIDMGFILREG